MARIRGLIGIVIGASILAAVASPTFSPQSPDPAVAQPLSPTPTAQPILATIADDIAAGDFVEASEPVEMPNLAPAQAMQYAHWDKQGLHFVGPWTAERLALVLSVLDHFEQQIGAARFHQLIEQGVAWHASGTSHSLTFVADPSHPHWIAAWRADLGQITLYDSLFDPAHLDAHYRWRFLDDLTNAAPGAVSQPAFAVAHELGHLIADGLRQEHIAHGESPDYLEARYEEMLSLNFWANPLQPSVNESVASEIGLWVYGIHRPFQVRAYHDDVLAPAILGEVR